MKILLVNHDTVENEFVKNNFEKNDEERSDFNVSKTIDEAYTWVKLNKVDLIIIDLNLCNGNCQNLLKKIKNRTFELAFITDFKPSIEFTENQEGIHILARPITDAPMRELDSNIKKKRSQRLLKQLVASATENMSNRIALKENDGIRFIHIDQIRLLSADNNYTEIYLVDGERIVTARTLKSFENELKDHPFYRIHQSHIVALNRIKKIISKEGLFVLLDNDQTVEIARRRKDGLIELLICDKIN